MLIDSYCRTCKDKNKQDMENNIPNEVVIQPHIDDQKPESQSKKKLILVSVSFVLLIFLVAVYLIYASVNTAFQHFKNAIRAEIDISQTFDNPSALPGSPFYGTKLLSENLYQYFLTSTNEKYLYTLFRANERIGEVHALLTNTQDQNANPSVSQLLFQKVFAQVPFQSPQLSLDQMNNIANNYLKNSIRIQSIIQRSLQSARKDRDVLKSVCLDNKLNQADVAIRSLSDRRNELELAITRNDRELAYHQYTIIVILYNKILQTNAEANQCIGEESAFVENSGTRVLIDTTVPKTSPSDEISPVDLRNPIPPATLSGNTNPISIDNTALQTSLQDYQKLQNELQSEAPLITDTNLLATTVMLTSAQPFIFDNDPSNQTDKTLTTAISNSITAGAKSIQEEIQTVNKSNQKLAAILAVGVMQNQQSYIVYILPGTPKILQLDLTNRIREYNNTLKYQAEIIGNLTKKEAMSQQISVQFLQSAIPFPSTIITSGKISFATVPVADLMIQTSDVSNDILNGLSHESAATAAILGEKQLSAEELGTLKMMQASASASQLKPVMDDLAKTDQFTQNLVTNVEASNTKVSDKAALVKTYHTLHGYQNTLSNTYSNLYSNHYSNAYSNQYSNLYSNVYSNLYSNVYSNVYSNLYSNVYGNTPSSLVPSDGSNGGGGQNSGGTNSGNGIPSAAADINPTPTMSYQQYPPYQTSTTNYTNLAPTTAPLPPTNPPIQPTSAPAPTSSTSNPSTMCAQNGGTWNGSTCVFPTP